MAGSLQKQHKYRGRRQLQRRERSMMQFPRNTRALGRKCFKVIKPFKSGKTSLLRRPLHCYVCDSSKVTITVSNGPTKLFKLTSIIWSTQDLVDLVFKEFGILMSALTKMVNGCDHIIGWTGCCGINQTKAVYVHEPTSRNCFSKGVERCGCSR